MSAESVRIAGKRSLWSRMASCWELYLILLPALLYYIFFKYVPMYGIVIAFKKLSISGGILGSDWVGPLYFEQLFIDPAFWGALKNTVILGLMKLIITFPIPILIAVLLNEISGKLFKRTVQTILYLPRFISWTVMSGIVLNLLAVNGGVVNNLIRLLGGEAHNFLADAGAFRWILVITTILKDAGWSSILYFAAVSGINPELYEACVVDGGGRFRQIWHITLPGIRPIITMMLILTVGNILSQDATQVLTLYSPNVYSTGDILGTYVFRTGIEYGRFSFAAAAGLFNSVVGTILILLSNWIAKHVGESTLF